MISKSRSMIAITFNLYFVIGMILLTTLYRTASFKIKSARNVPSSLRMMSVQSDVINAQTYESFVTSKAKTTVPTNLKTLLELLQLKGETLVDPIKSRKGMNPFLIPLSKNPTDNSFTCYLRWPTQKETSPLQIVKTEEAGLTLLSLDTDKLCHRYAVEFDFINNSNAAKAVELINKAGIPYTTGDYMPMIKSGKFPSLTKEDLSLILDRYLLTKVGSFPDCHERIANNFLKTGSEVSAFVTCERGISVYYGWGHPMRFNAMLLKSVKGRELEAKDAARAGMYVCMY